MAIGRQKLQKIYLPGGVEFDPETQNFFKMNVEEGEKLKDVDDLLGLGETNPYRHLAKETRLALVPGNKGTGNSGAYGILGETNEQDLAAGKTERVELLYDSERPLETHLLHPEDPGPFCCPPLAGLITAGARLMLGIAHRLVMDRGGIVAFGDTDSLAIVATENGEDRNVETVGRGPVPVKTLSWAEVVAIAAAFEALNPYDPALVKGSILEIKEVNYDGEKTSAGFKAQSTRDMIELTALCISSKRYDLVRPDGNLADKKESMLGMLLSPLDPSPGDDRRDASREWITEAWLAIDDLWERRRCDRPWMQRPCVRRMAATSPAVMRIFAALNSEAAAGRNQDAAEPDEQEHIGGIRPFNFFIAATAIAPGGLTQCVVAPFERDPEKWSSLEWLRTDDGSVLPLGVPDRDGAVWRQKTVGEFLREYVNHSSPEWIGADGLPCHAETRGVLARRPIRDGDRYLLTKESLTWSDDPKHAFTLVQPVTFQLTGEERQARLSWNTIARPAVKAIGASAVAKRLNTDTSTVRRWQKGTTTPADISTVEKAAALCAEDMGLFTADEMRQHSTLSLLELAPQRVALRQLYVAFMVNVLSEKHGGARALAKAMSDQRKTTALSSVQAWRRLDKVPSSAADLNAILARLADFSKRKLRELGRRVQVTPDPISQQNAVLIYFAALLDVRLRVKDGILNTPTSLEKEARELFPSELTIWVPAIVFSGWLLCTLVVHPLNQ